MSTPVSPSVRWLVYVVACVAFALVLFVRGGPNPAETDAHAVTLPATAISHGDLTTAARQTVVPNPPGYPLLTAPIVAAFRPWVGAPRWCDDKPVPALLRGQGYSYYRSILGPCGTPEGTRDGMPLPPWYRSQALLVIGAWVMLAVGALAFLRAATQRTGIRPATTGRSQRPTRTGGELVLVGTLVALPAASDAIAQSFHPQDLVSVGLTCAALACVLRRRWVAVGVLFAGAFLCKQFALLALFAAVAAAPGWRARARILLPFGAGVAGGVVPFYLVDRVDTLRALTGVYVAGAGVVKTPTFVGLLGIVEHTKLEIARDAPLALAAALCVWAWWWARERLLAPLPLVGLALACMASRLVFEIAILNYYWLAVGVYLLLLDAVHRRPPLLSMIWVVCSRYGLTWMVTAGMPSLWIAAAFGALSLAPLAAGLAEVRSVRSPAPAVRGADRAHAGFAADRAYPGFAADRAHVGFAAVVAEPALWISAPSAPAGAGSGRQ